MMTKRLQVLSYGEALVDFLPDRAGARLRDVETFSKTVGGAPANAAVGLARLGCRAGLLGKVGADEFGHFLVERLAAEGVDSTSVGQTSRAKTGITFISLDESGDRSFLFFREPSADMTITIEDIDEEVVADCDVFVAGSNLLTRPGVREATFHAIGLARDAGALVVIDPNVRPHLWEDFDDCLQQLGRELRMAHIVKLNDEELEYAGGGAGADALWQDLRQHGVRALVVTHAERGAEVFTPTAHVETPAPKVDVRDTTGAGDGFVAGLITGILRRSGARTPHDALGSFDERDWTAVLSLGCHVGSMVCRSLGATPSLPNAADIPWAELDFHD